MKLLKFQILKKSKKIISKYPNVHIGISYLHVYQYNYIKVKSETKDDDIDKKRE